MSAGNSSRVSTGDLNIRRDKLRVKFVFFAKQG